LLLDWHIAQVTELELTWSGVAPIPADSADKLMERSFQSARELDDRAESRLALSSLEQSDLGAVKPCHFAKRLL
jgi:hypothetical protein